jgi:hypothetical protein
MLTIEHHLIYWRRSISWLLLVAGLCPSIPAHALVPGVAEALSPGGEEGQRVDVPGPPSEDRHPGKNDPQRWDNSIAKSHDFVQGRRDIPGGVYQTCREKWLTTRYPEISLEAFSDKALEHYEEHVLSQFTWPTLTRVDVEPMTLVYPAGYGANEKEAAIAARRLTLRAVDSFGDERSVVAYYLNYDKIRPGNNRVVVQVNGHFGIQPSRMNLGLKDRGGITGAAVAKIALAGHPIITYDDHNVGESSPSTGKEDGLYVTLGNMRMLDEALLLHFDRVDVIGLSGGTERLYHFLMFNRCPIYTAYLAGFFTSTWMPMDSVHTKRGPFGINPDTHHDVYLTNFQRADHVLVGIAKGVDVRLAVHTHEGGSMKECYHYEFLPAVRQYTDRFTLGGDDPDGDGVSNDGSDLAHEYHMGDYFAFLEESLAKPAASDEILLHCRDVPEDGLAFIEVDLTETARHLGLLPLTFSRLYTGENVEAQFIPSPDFNPHSAVRGRALLQFPGGGDQRMALRIGPARGTMPEAWDGVAEGVGFSVRHSAETGGLPSRIEYAHSGNAYDTFAFNDRVHTGSVGSYHLKNDSRALMEKLGEGPHATVIRTRAEYLHESGKSAELDAVYDWFYLRDRAIVLVETMLVQRRLQEWGEAHVLEFNVPDESFTRWMGGDPFQEGAFSAGKDFFGLSSWGILLNEDDAIAMFQCGEPRIYDGRGDYGTYLHAHGNATWRAWSQPRRAFSSSVWLGAADKARDAVSSAIRSAPGRSSASIRLRWLENELEARANALDELSGEERYQSEFELSLARRWSVQGRAVDAVQLLKGETMTSFHQAGAGNLRLTIEDRAGGLALQSVRDSQTGLEFLAASAPPLFTLKVREVESGKEVELDAESGWRSVEIEPGEGRLALHFSSPERAGLERLSVTMTAHLDNAAHRIRWNVAVRNETEGWSLLNVVFPQLAVGELGEDGCVFFPRAPGEVETGLWRKNFKHSGLYPEPWTTMQYVAAYPADGRAGLYVAAHDPSGSPKQITIESHPETRAVAFTYDQPAADMSLPGNDYETVGEVVWQLFRGDWFDASVIYRDWVRENARWYPQWKMDGKDPGDGRDDTPKWMRELPIWVSRSGPFEEVVARTKEFKEEMGVPVGLHWYNWHAIPFDNDYPHYFPTKPGFAERVAELQEAGIYVMPYINGRLWDTHDRGAEDFEFTKVALPAATKDEEGKPYIESYGSEEEDGSKVELAVMCPATPLWQERVRDICMRLFGECGVDSVYIDQVAAMSPRLCMDPSHGHPLGGGTWWNEGYWKMLQSIRDAMPEGAMLTTECNSEPFAHVFDGYLSWTWQHDGQVPAFCVVYGGALQVFGRQYGGNHPAKRMKGGQQLVFGEQLGWMWPDMMNENEETTKFFRDLCQLRWKLRRYFAAGEMARPPTLAGEMPTLTENWEWANSKSWFVTTDAVLCGAWALPQDEKLVMMFVNVSEEPVTASFSWDAAAYKITAESVQRRRITADDEGEPERVEARVTEELTFPPLTPWAWEIDFSSSN